MCASIITDQNDRLSWMRSFTGVIQQNEHRQMCSTIVIPLNTLENFTVIMKYAHIYNKQRQSGKSSSEISCRDT